MANPNFPPPKCPIHGPAIKRDRCPDCRAAYMREYMRWRRLQKPSSLLVERARRRARETRLPFSIDRDCIVVPLACPALGVPITIGGGRSHGSPSLDRIVPHLGYIPGNVRVISDKANRLKGDRSLSELQDLALKGSLKRREEYRRLAAYVDRELLLQQVWQKATARGKAGDEWRKVAQFLDRIFSRGLIDVGQ